MKKENKNLRLSRSIFAVFCLLLLFAILAMVTFSFVRSSNKQKLSDLKYSIQFIVQTSVNKDGLKTQYLAELMELSRNRVKNIFTFAEKQAEMQALKSPLIKNIKVKKIPPNTLYVNYDTYQPVALLFDYDNTAISKEKIIFPYYPFFSPKNLPEIVLGLPPFGSGQDNNHRKGGMWQTPLEGRHISLAFHILQLLSDVSASKNFRLIRIDVSKAFSSSYGKREIVIQIEDEITVQKGDKRLCCIFPQSLRFSSRNYSHQLGNYLVLRESILKDYKAQIQIIENMPSIVRFKSKVFDFRLSKIAFIES